MVASRADIAAADLHARIARDVRAGLLAGVEAEVMAVRGRHLRIVLTRLPIGAVQWTEQGLAPTAAGALVTDRLHQLAKQAGDHAGLTYRCEFVIRPAALAAAAGAHTSPQRRVS